MALVLVGMMGTGKSTIAKLIAQMTGNPVWDMDHIIEHEEGMPVAEIFRAKSEAYFRQKESELLLRVTCKMRVVLSTGGGVVLSASNREHLSTLGLVVWLKARPETIFSRVQLDSSRPLLGTAPDIQKIAKLCVEREPLYRSVSNREIQVEESTPFQIADLIVSDYNRHK